MCMSFFTLIKLLFLRLRYSSKGLIMCLIPEKSINKVHCTGVGEKNMCIYIYIYFLLAYILKILNGDLIFKK